VKAPRTPNQEELEQLVRYVLERQHDHNDAEEVEMTRLLVNGAYIAVFDYYITDCPGYSGKLMVVVWPGAPSLYQAFIWSDQKMIQVNQDPL
jgi:cephalosporin hydroxylase